jgi:hypothetical protein
MGLLASDAHPRSFAALAVAALGGSGAALGASGAAQALPPHTSEFDKLLAPREPKEPRGLELAVVDGAGEGFVWLAERLNTDVVVVVVALASAGCGAAAGGGEDAERSNRSPKAEEAGAGAGLDGTADELIDPQPDGLPMDCLDW